MKLTKRDFLDSFLFRDGFLNNLKENMQEAGKGSKHTLIISVGKCCMGKPDTFSCNIDPDDIDLALDAIKTLKYEKLTLSHTFDMDKNTAYINVA